MKKRILYLLLLSSASTEAMNLLRPYDTLIKPMFIPGYCFQVDTYGETGIKGTGYNSNGSSVNVLRIWNTEQDALAMLRGFPVTSPVGKLLSQIDANDDGIRGHFCIDGDLKMHFGGLFSAGYNFCDDWVVSAYLPIYATELTNVCFKDLTQDVTAEDIRVKELLTNSICQNVAELGCLDLSGWKRIGPGDLTFFLAWYRDFPQMKPLLRSVRLNWRLGLGIPTGFRWDEDRLFAIPYGYDGSVSLPFGVGLDLTFAFHVRTGFDVQLTHVFGNTRSRRIKTDISQTDLFLLQKAQVYRDPGIIQRYNLYFQLFRVVKGLSFMLGYQYYKQGADVISLEGNIFSQAVANSAIKLDEWTMHHIVVRADYDFGFHVDDDAWRPQFELFARMPFNGKRVAVNTTIGAVFSVSF